MRRRSTRGISTAEILVGSALSLMALGSMYSFFLGQTRAMAVQAAYSQSQNVTRTLIDLMTRELRMAAYDPTDLAIPTTVGSCPGMNSGIMDARTDLLQFRQDLNGDGDVSDSGETITYDFVEGRIRRKEGDAEAVVIVDGVPEGGFRFRYYDGSRPRSARTSATASPGCASSPTPRSSPRTSARTRRRRSNPPPRPGSPSATSRSLTSRGEHHDAPADRFPSPPRPRAA